MTRRTDGKALLAIRPLDASPTAEQPLLSEVVARQLAHFVVEEWCRDLGGRGVEGVQHHLHARGAAQPGVEAPDRAWPQAAGCHALAHAPAPSAAGNFVPQPGIASAGLQAQGAVRVLLTRRYSSYTSRKNDLTRSSLRPSCSSRNLVRAAVVKAETCGSGG